MSESIRFNRDMTDAEYAIYMAMMEVELLPPDERLTQAIIKLGEARTLVADFSDSVFIQYNEYVKNGGTMKLSEWEKDGRFDPGYSEQPKQPINHQPTTIN